MQSLIRSKSAGVTGGRGTAGAGPGRDLLYPCLSGAPVISWGIWASQKLSGGTPQDLIELRDPKILGYLLIFGSYFKPIAYC